MSREEELIAENEALRVQLREMALDVLAASGQAQEAYEAQLAAEAEAARLRAEAEKIAAQRDEAILRARDAKSRVNALEARCAALGEKAKHATKACRTMSDRWAAVSGNLSAAEADLAQADDLIRQYSAALFIISEKTECAVTRKIAREVLGPELLAEGAAMFAKTGGVH